MTPWLSQPEIDDMCCPLTQWAAQIRYMREQGLIVRTKPNGAPLVMRTHFEQVMNPQSAEKTRNDRPRPNREALVAHIKRAA